MISTEAKSQHPVNDRTAESRARFIILRGSLSLRALDARLTTVLFQIRAALNEAHRTPFGTGTEQRPLRTPQHFHALEIEDFRKQGGGGKGELTGLNRHIVDVDAGRRST